jgi:hypothetical protein
MDHLHSSQPADRREQSALSLDGSIRNVRRGSGPGYSPNCLSRVQPRYYEKWALITKNDNIMAAQGSKGQAMLRTVSVLMLMTIAPPVIAENPTMRRPWPRKGSVRSRLPSGTVESVARA